MEFDEICFIEYHLHHAIQWDTSLVKFKIIRFSRGSDDTVCSHTTLYLSYKNRVL